MKNVKYEKQNSLGITLIELVITIGILIILSTMAIPFFWYFQKKSDLNNNTEEIVNILRLAQNKTLASESASNYGVYFESDKFVLFKGTNYDPLSEDNNIRNLSENLEIYEIILTGGGLAIVFDRVVGTTSQFGSISLRLKTNPSKSQTIYIENSGQVGLTSLSIPSDESRIKDSRHVHFNLVWSIQNATTLKFNFVNASQIETIDMVNYFNVDETEFDWEGMFNVNEVDQTFRIHTHSLSAFDTLLCIHRNRNNGNNTEKVTISIIDGGIEKDIVYYLADLDDTVEKGSYVGTMETQ